MKLFLCLALFAVVQGYAQDCELGEWGPWGEWLTEDHDLGESYPAGSKTGVGRQTMADIMEQKKQLRDALKACKAAGTCPMYLDRPSEGPVSCVNGFVNDLECLNVDQVSFLNISSMFFNPAIDPSPWANDNWGWTDPSNGDEYVIQGLTTGTSFIRITDPTNPVVVGHVQTHTSGTGNEIWRDIKVIGNFAYIVSEETDHGIQIFDLTRLRGVVVPEMFLPDAHYGEVGNCHNIVASEETGYFYAVGCTYGNYPNLCEGGLHVVNAADPLNPTYEGCFGGDGYVHDAQCTVYRGPDTTYNGREICFCYNEEDFTIVDVDDKANMALISRTNYTGVQYTHQGWLTEDHAIVLMDDEGDESQGSDPITKTYIWDVQDLTSPVLMNIYRAPVESIDHNQYIVGGYAFQANYETGLRILSIDQATYSLTLVGYFDVFPGVNEAGLSGSWNVYPFFSSGNLAVSSTEFGLFTVVPDYSALDVLSRTRTAEAERRRYRELLAGESNRCPSLTEVQRL